MSGESMSGESMGSPPVAPPPAFPPAVPPAPAFPPGLAPSGDFTSMLCSSVLLALWLYDAAKYMVDAHADETRGHARSWCTRCKSLVPLVVLALTLVCGALAQSLFILSILLDRGFQLPELIALLSNGFGAVYGLFALFMLFGSIFFLSHRLTATSRIPSGRICSASRTNAFA